jgi:hypothetical protein
LRFYPASALGKNSAQAPREAAGDGLPAGALSQPSSNRTPEFERMMETQRGELTSQRWWLMTRYEQAETRTPEQHPQEDVAASNPETQTHMNLLTGTKASHSNAPKWPSVLSSRTVNRF